MAKKKPIHPSTYLEDISPAEARKLLDIVRSYVPEDTSSWGWILFWLVVWLAAIGAIIAFVLFGGLG
jgi:hypothetical protein